MIIDCTRCPARRVSCDGCVMTLVVGTSADPVPEVVPQPARLTAEERRAVAVLAAAGLIDPPAGWGSRPVTRLAG